MSREPARFRRRFNVGLIQSACSPDPAANLRQTLAAAAARGRRRRRARSSARQELFRSQYFCQSEDHDLFPTGGADSRAHHRGVSKARPKAREVVSSRRSSRNAPRAFTTTQRPSLMPTVRCWASIARCTSRTTRCITRSFTSRRATWASAPGRPGTRKIGVLICWDQWYPEAARLTAMQGAEILFYPTAIGWHPAEKAAYGERQHSGLGNHPAQPRNGQRLLSWPCPTASGTRNSPAAMASSSGARAL